jgi:hypothetical protein
MWELARNNHETATLVKLFEGLMSHLILRNSKETRLDGEDLVKSPGKLIGEAYNP